MTGAEVVHAYLLTLSAVTALVGGRIWTYRFKQSPTLPAVLVSQVSEIQFGHLRGTVGLRWCRIQIDVISATIREARQVDQAVMGAYATGSPVGPTGLLGVHTSVGSPAVVMICPAVLGYREPDFEADELRLSRTSRDYQVWFDGLVT